MHSRTAAGCLDLGMLYAIGKGVTQDFAQAAAFFRKVSDLKTATT